MMPVTYLYRMSQSEREALYRLLGVVPEVNDALTAGEDPVAAVAAWINEKLQAAFDEGREVAGSQRLRREVKNQ